MVSRVCVYVITADPNGAAALHVNSLFSNDLFTVNRVTADPRTKPMSANNTLGNMPTAENQELARVTGCLQHAKKNYPGQYVIIVKDTSTSVASPDDIAGYVKGAIKIAAEWDIFWLCDWLSYCEQLGDGKDIGGVQAVSTKDVHALQALIVSPYGQRLLLGEIPLRKSKVPIKYRTSVMETIRQAVANEDIEACAVKTNIIVYDLRYAQGSADYAKDNRCLLQPANNAAVASMLAAPPAMAGVTPTLAPLVPSRDNTGPWIWGGLALLAILVIVVVIVYARRKKNVMPVEEVV